jgi:hypothetical protein
MACFCVENYNRNCPYYSKAINNNVVGIHGTGPTRHSFASASVDCELAFWLLLFLHNSLAPHPQTK